MPNRSPTPVRSMEYNNRRSLRQRQNRRKAATQSHGPTVPPGIWPPGRRRHLDRSESAALIPLRIEGIVTPLRPVRWTERSPWHCSHRHAEPRAPKRGLLPSHCSAARPLPRAISHHHPVLPLAKSAGVTNPSPLTLTPVTRARALRAYFFQAKRRLTSRPRALARGPCDAAGSSRGPATPPADPPGRRTCLRSNRQSCGSTRSSSPSNIVLDCPPRSAQG